MSEHIELSQLDQRVPQRAAAWLKAGVTPSLVESFGSSLVILLKYSSDAQFDLKAARQKLQLPHIDDPWLNSLTGPVSRKELASLCAHLLDVAERMAQQQFVLILPALEKKSNRSGEAARSVGVARHLRG